MKKFLLNLLDSDNPSSSKRFVGLVGAFILFGLTIYFHTDILINSLVMVVVGAFGITGLESIFKKKDEITPDKDKNVEEK